MSERNAMVYVLDDKNQIIKEWDCDFNDAIMYYHGKRDENGNRYFIIVKGKKVPFKHKRRKLRDVKPIADQQDMLENEDPEQESLL